MRNNDNIRRIAKRSGVYLWEVADYFGISEMTITRKLRHELTNEEIYNFENAIENRVMQATYTGNDSGCIGCTYWRHFGWYGVNYTNACHFLLDTGKMRGCSPQECNKKKLDGGNNNGNCKK